MSLFEKSEITVAQPGQRTPEEEKKMLGYPSMRPMDFDGTLEAWLFRLKEIWGTVVIKHKHPENFKGVREVSSDYFLDIVGNEEDNKLFGLWKIDQLTTNRLIFYRKYEAVDGKHYKKEFDIEIKLKPSLQKALDVHGHKGFLGGMKKMFGF